MLNDREYKECCEGYSESAEKGDYRNILKYSLLLLEHEKCVSSPDYEGIATLHDSAGTCYVHFDKCEEGLEHYKNSLEILKQHLPSEKEKIATSYNNIGETYDRMGNHDKALEYYTTALEIRREVLPPMNLDIAWSYNNIGSVLVDMQKYDEALLYHTKALEIRKELRPPEHEDVFVSQTAIGVIHGLSGQHGTDALDSLMQTFASFGDASSLKTETEYNTPEESLRLAPAAMKKMMSAMHYKKRRFDEALTLLNEAPAIEKEVLGENHPELASTYELISSIYRELGKSEDAMSFMEKSLKLQENE